MENIDFVITWVDGNDKEWKKEKDKYYLSKEIDSRFRDWDNLKFWFRGVEKYADWVHKIYFITWGHIPKWLNKEHKKIVIIKHSDYIPDRYLPTFSSHPIELNFHRIPNLSEKFVYFNDDTFILNYVTKKIFFKNGLPVDRAIMTMLCDNDYEDLFKHILLNNAVLINKNFNKKTVLKQHPNKFYNIKYGKGIINNIFSSFWNEFSSFQFTHLPQPFLLSTLKEVWMNEGELLDLICKNKFRNYNDVNQYIFRYWQYCKGNFTPGKCHGKYFIAGDMESYKAIKQRKYKLICINDVNLDLNFENEKSKIISAFEEIFPTKSSYEI